ncbi:MAG: glycosyltransferase family 39 protein [Elusimicrobiota bacterium]
MADAKPRPGVSAVFIISWGIFCLLGAGFIRSAAPTYDEPVHLASGYSVLAGAARSLNYRDHPPFGELWAALPLLPIKPLAFFSSPEWLSRRVYHYGNLFLYQNRIPARRMMNRARFWCLISWGGILCFAVMEWASRLGGFSSEAFAGIFFAFCPALISNLSLVATDAPAAVFFFLTFWMLSFNPRRLRHWLGAGIFAGLGAASKFSMAAIAPVVLAGILTEARSGKDEKSSDFIKTAILGAPVMVAAALFALWAAYGFGDLGLYWIGLRATLARLGNGRSSFLFGHYSTRGWPWYFPAAVAIKTPIPILVFTGIGIVIWLKKPTREFLWIFLPPVAFFFAACFSKTQIGYRHVLPIYPFMLVAAGCAAARLWGRNFSGRALACGLSLWLIAGVARVYPYYLAYFNEFSGGASNGYRCLADSNLDWGQDMQTLGRYLAARGNPLIFLSYFGTADPAYYGVRYIPVGFVSNVERPGSGAWSSDDSGPVLFAISATNLDAVYYRDKSVFSWLKRRRPIFRAGYSIFVYDLTRDHKGLEYLEKIIYASGNRNLARRLQAGHAS